MQDYYHNGIPHHEPGVGLSKHQVIICTPNTASVEPPKQIYITKQCQGRKERAALSRAIQLVVWTPMYTMQTCEDHFYLFHSTLKMLLDEFLPMKTVKRNSNDHLWVNDDFLSMIAMRQYYFHTNNTAMFRIYRNKVNRERKKLEAKFYENKMNGLKKENPKEWWNEIKDITGRKKKSNDLQGMADALCDGDKTQLAEAINHAFQSVSDDMVPLTASDSFTVGDDNTVPDRYIISVEQVERRLTKINTSKAVGPDAIPNWLLKDLAPWLASPVCAIWNSSLRESYLPDIWKSGDVCPLPKVNPPL